MKNAVLFLGVLFFYAGILTAQKTPPPLQKGDTIAIVAPAGVIKNANYIKKAATFLKVHGFSPLLGKHIFKKNGHFAGSDAARAEDLQAVLDDKTVKAIWCARGGYGTIRIIDRLNFQGILKNPKWLIGYSDITVLHQRLNALGIKTIHALMPTDLKRDSIGVAKSFQGLLDHLENGFQNEEMPAHFENILGQGSGVLLGGNLTILQGLMGSKASLPKEDFILFLEEVGEYKYRIDRMLRTLLRAGFFERCKGIIVGDMHPPKNTPAFMQTVPAILKGVLRGQKIPIAFGFPAGHISNARALLLGGYVTLSVQSEKTTLQFLTGVNTTQ